MKLRVIFALATLMVMVNGAWWAAAAVQPVLLSLGAMLGAIDLEVLNLQPIELKKWMPYLFEPDGDEEEFEKKMHDAKYDDEVAEILGYDEEGKKARREMLDTP